MTSFGKKETVLIKIFMAGREVGPLTAVRQEF
jgi:hypothetical protein